LKSLLKVAFKTLITVGTIGLLAYFAWIYVIPRLSEHDSRQHDSKLNEQNRKESYSVKRVIDGDSFEIDEKDVSGKNIRVKLLGADSLQKIDTGKTKSRFSRLSGDYARRILDGKKVLLVPENNFEDKDKYGSILRYVYLEDGTFINMKLIEDGYASANRQNNISKKNDFIKAENKARDQKKGLWADGLQMPK